MHLAHFSHSFRFRNIIFIKYVLLFLQVGVQAVLSILLATFAGLGVAMSGSSIIVEILRWRRRLEAQEQQQDHNSQIMSRPSLFPHSSRTVPRDQPQQSEQEESPENPETQSRS